MRASFLRIGSGNACTLASSRLRSCLSLSSGIEPLQVPAHLAGRKPRGRPLPEDPHQPGLGAFGDVVVAHGGLAALLLVAPPAGLHALRPDQLAQRAAVARTLAVHLEQ